MSPILRDKTLQRVRVTIYPGDGSRKGNSRTLTVYGATVAQVAQIIAGAFAAPQATKKRRSA